MGLSAIADRMVGPPSLSRDLKWPRPPIRRKTTFWMRVTPVVYKLERSVMGRKMCFSHRYVLFVWWPVSATDIPKQKRHSETETHFWNQNAIFRNRNAIFRNRNALLKSKRKILKLKRHSEIERDLPKEKRHSKIETHFWNQKRDSETQALYRDTAAVYLTFVLGTRLPCLQYPAFRTRTTCIIRDTAT